MNIFSPLESIVRIDHIITNNHPSSLTGVCSPVLGGESWLVDNLELKFNDKSRVAIFKMSAKDFDPKPPVIDDLLFLLNDQYGIQDIEALQGLAIGDELFAILKKAEQSISLTCILLITDFQSLQPQKQYELSAQMRNLREKIRSQRSNMQFHSVIFGSWEPGKIFDLSRINTGSFPFDDYWYLGSCEQKDVASLLCERFGEEADELVVEYLYELTKGCLWEILEVLKELKEVPACKTIDKKINLLINDPVLTRAIQTVQLGNEGIPIPVIVDLLNGKKLIWDESHPLLEKLYISGLVRKTNVGKRQVMEIRSWPHEMILRSHLKETIKEVYTCLNEIIPPSTALNKIVYARIMRLENDLRNLIILSLAEESNGQHPFRLLDVLGKFKINQKTGEQNTLFDYAQKSRNRYKERVGLGLHPSLSSYIELGDIIEILDKSYSIQNPSLVKFNERIAKVFPDRKELLEMLYRLKDIRNPVAHNIVISPETEQCLSEVAKRLESAYLLVLN